MKQLSLTELKNLIPSYITEVAETLQKGGFEAYLVGGSVRDVLLGREPQDYDVATNAYPEQITAIFPKSIPTGAQFGTITVIGEDDQGEKYDVQVTTYRAEYDYAGGRWPTKVEFTKTIQEDLSRRDFTINAMALNLQEFDEQILDVKQLLIDPFGGLVHLDAKLIKAVGNPLERFSEDGLRPMRACRLASQLEFTIDPVTMAAMQQTNHITKMVSAERLRDEFMKMLLKSPKPSYGLNLMKEAGILELVIPELLEGIGVVQPEFHTDDVYTHSLKTVDAAEDSIKLAALLHDIGKPRTRIEDENGIHFYGHDQIGAEMAREIMTRLKFSNAEIDRTVRLIRWHMFYYPSADWRNGQKDFDFKNATKEEMSKYIEDTKSHRSAAGWSDAAIRRLIINVGGEEAIDDLLKLRIADATGNPMSEFNPEELKVLSERIADVRARDMALKITDLDITGHDLMEALNIPAGPKLGQILNYLLNEVIEDPLKNEKSQLLELSTTYINSLA